MTDTNYINPTNADSIFEFELFRAEAILNSMLDFFTIFEAEEFKDQDLNKSLKKVALQLNPCLSDIDAERCASLPVLTLAFNQATDLLSRSIAAWKLQEKVPTTDMETLLKETRLAMIDDSAKTELVPELPWILSEALARICHEGTVIKQPNSQVAVGARILACTVEKLREMPDLNQKAPSVENSLN